MDNGNSWRDAKRKREAEEDPAVRTNGGAAARQRIIDGTPGWPGSSTDDDLNPGAKDYDAKTAFNGAATRVKNAEEAASDRPAGSLDDATPEERRAAIAASEQSGQDQSSFNDSSEKSPYQGNDLKSRLLRLRNVKGKGATTGIAASILFIGGIMLSMAGGSSFWASLEKNLTNDANDDARINTELHRAFNSLFTRSCKPGSLACKFKTMTKTQVQKWKDGFAKIKGQILDKNGNPTRGSPDDVVDPDTMKDGERVAASEVVFNDGYTATNADQVNTHLENNIGQRDLMTRAFSPKVDSFINGFGEMMREKFGISKARATPEEQKTSTGEDSVKAATNEAVNKAKGSTSQRLLRAATSSTAQVLQTAIDYTCMGYNATRIAVGTVKAAWATDLIRFAYPFVRLAAKIQDGSATDEDYQQIQDKFTQLVDYMSNTRAAELEGRIRSGSLNDVDKRELQEFGIDLDDDTNTQIQQIEQIKNKNAFDSMGLQQAIYGNTQPLTDFTKKFGTGIVGTGTITASFIVGKLQNMAGFGFGAPDGKQNIKSFCKANKALGAMMMAGGLSEAGFDIINCFAAAGTGGLDAPSDAVCLKRLLVAGLKTAAYIKGFELAGELITTAITTYIMKEAPNLPSDALRGPAAGEAIASGIGLLLAHKAASSGLKPAMSMASINSYISSTQEHYDQYGDQLAYYNARDTPFDASNRFSFLGQIIGSLNPKSTKATSSQSGIFSYVSNLLGVVSGTFSTTASALHSEPSLMTVDQSELAARTSNGACVSDEEKADSGMMCDRTSGRTIQVASPRVLQWAKEDATGKTDHLGEAIAWLQKPQKGPEMEDGGGTQDETCTDLIEKVIEFMSTDWGSLGKCSDSGEKASIDENGAPVPGSQYEKFLTYCKNRKLEPGSTDLDQEIGSAKEQVWHDGTQCGMTYDSNGNSSTGYGSPKGGSKAKFDPSKDTGKGSLMMDYFTYYSNMCYVQYATQNGATDCTNDNPPDTGDTGSAPVTGSIAEVAKEMGSWGAQYKACYKYGGGHGAEATTDWMKQAIANHFTGAYAVDCSAFVRAVILQATGKDIGSEDTNSMCADTKNFEHIPRGSAQPGDLAIDCANHVEVITAVSNGAITQTVGARTDGCGAGMGASPANYQGTGNFVLRFKG
jgi:hypothetical protein